MQRSQSTTYRDARWGHLHVPFLMALLCLSGAASAGQGTTRTNVAEKYGLTESTADRPLIEQAVALANAVVAPGAGIRLVPSWRPAGPTGAIPIYLVKEGAIGSSEIAFVPTHERAIFITDSGLRLIRTKLSGYKQVGLELHWEEAFALVLLHELGHIYYKDNEYEAATVAFSLDDLSSPPSMVKNREIRADMFAVAQIRNAMAPKSPADRFAAGLSMNLFLPNVAWNLMSQRLLGDFGGTGLSKKDLFLESENTHPNFELRFLVMDYALHHSKDARTVLADFLEHRKKAAAKRAVTPNGRR
jgi:hypothetical protein